LSALAIAFSPDAPPTRNTLKARVLIIGTPAPRLTAPVAVAGLKGSTTIVRWPVRPPVIEDSRLSAGDRAHARYLVKNFERGNVFGGACIRKSRAIDGSLLR